MTVPNHVMVDLETLGSGPGCAILSIGAVAFDPGGRALGDRFYQLVNTRSCRALGLREEAGTLAWWDRQSEQARTVLAEAETCDVALGAALGRFAGFLARHKGDGGVKVWGNGADFDNAILAHLYDRLGLEQPWAFWNSRCYRTLKNLRPDVRMGRSGVHHNALDDAVSQATHAQRIMRALAGVDPAPD